MRIKSVAILFCCLVIYSVQLSAQTLSEALKLTDNEQFSEASKMYARLIRQNNSGENNFYMGENYFRQEMLDSAMFYYEKGLAAQPDYALNNVGVGKVNWYKNNVDAAKNAFEKAMMATKSKDVKVLCKIAECYISADKKEIEKALELLTIAQKLEPKNIEVYLLTGDAYKAQQDGNKAIENYKKVQALDPSSVKGLLRQGQLYGSAKNYQLAFDLYNQAAQIDSNFAPAYREQAELYYLSKQYERAKRKYKKFLELSSNNIDARKRYASFMFLSKDYAETINQINLILKEDTSSNIMNRLIAYSYVEKNEISEAQKFMDKFFARAENEKTKIIASDFEYLAKINMKQGKDSIAVINYLKALKLDSTKTEIYGDLGVCCFKMKKNEDAINYFSQKQKTKAGLTVNEIYMLGKAYYFNKQYDMADTTFGSMISLKPDLQQGYFWKARTASVGDPETTKGLAKPWYEKYLDKAIANNEKNLKDLEEAYAYLGYYYFLQKDKVNAKQNWSRVLELNPSSDKAKKALESLK